MTDPRLEGLRRDAPDLRLKTDAADLEHYGRDWTRRWTPAPLAIAWCLRNPHVSSVILGASRTEQLLQNLEALELAERVDEGGWQRVEAAVG
ncbi:aldo/keto reductase [Lysobacter sp. 2RAB21]